MDDKLKYWEIIQALFPLVQYDDFNHALDCIAIIQNNIIGRHCGDLGDKLAQYMTIVQFFRESGLKNSDSIEIGVLFGGSCLIKLMAMKKLGVKGKIICIDPMEGYYGQRIDPHSGHEVKKSTLYKNLQIFNFPENSIELRSVKSNDLLATKDLSGEAFATLLIDGDHSYQGVHFDWKNFSPFVNTGGFVLFDDYGDSSWPDITRFVNELIISLPKNWKSLGQIGITYIFKKNSSYEQQEKNSSPSNEKDQRANNFINYRNLINDGYSGSIHKKTLALTEILKKSNDNISEYQNKHRHQRCVIIGNGPSLNKMNLSFLKNEITFGMNRIYLLFDKWNFVPTYYVSVNPLVIEQSANEIIKIPSPKFLSFNGLQYVLNAFVQNPNDFIFIRSITDPPFSKDPRNGLCEGYTVTYVAMQLAYYMGFSEVILIGVDHHFVTSGRPNQEVISEGPDPNHFHPSYFGKGIRWNLPDLKNSEIYYRIAKTFFESDGRRILDATVNGKLTIFPKIDYEQVFSKNTETVPGCQSLPKFIEEIGKLKHIKHIESRSKKANTNTDVNQKLQEYPDSPELLNEQAVLKLHQGDKQGAKEVFLEIIKKHPTYYPSYNNLACLYWNERDFENASKYFEEALKIVKSQAIGNMQTGIEEGYKSVVMGYGEMLMSIKKYAKAKELFKGYLKTEPNNAEIRFLLKKCEDILEKTKNLTKVIENFPNIGQS